MPSQWPPQRQGGSLAWRWKARVLDVEHPSLEPWLCLSWFVTLSKILTSLVLTLQGGKQ